MSFRRCQDQMQAFYTVVRPIAEGQRKAGKRLAPFVYKVLRTSAIAHPSSWLMCSTCETTALAENGTDCTMCHGAGFVMSTEYLRP